MVDSPNLIWRDYVTDGVPTSGLHDPRKPKIRGWAAWVDAGLNAGTLNGPWKATKAALDSDLAHDADTVGFVYETADIGTYVKSGASGSGSWSKELDFIPGFQLALATDDGGSTANAHTMDTAPRASSGDGVTLIRGFWPETNTSATVTIAFDGGTALSVKTLANNNPAVGGLVQGAPFIGQIAGSGTEFRLLSDQSGAAIQAGAEAAKTAAETAQGAAEAAAAGVNLPSIGSGDADGFLQVKDDESGFEISSPAVVRPIIMGAGSPWNLEWNADKTGVTAADTAWNEAVATGRPIYAPRGTYRFTTAKALSGDMKVFGDHVARSDAGGGNPGAGTTFLFNTVEGFSVNDGTEHENLYLADFQIRQSGNWGANTLTGLFLSNVYSSHFHRIRVNYHQYGFFSRRTDPGSGYLPNYFNVFDECETFGCQYGFTDFDNGATNNNNTYLRCRSEDNGQRSGGYGISIDSVGTNVFGFYGGLPNHDAALVIENAALNCVFMGIYGESATLGRVIRDKSPAGRPNTIIGVHADGVSTLVTKTVANNDNTYQNADSSTNVFPEKVATQSRTPAAIGGGAYDYITITVSGIAPGDTAVVVPPSAWDNGLIVGQPRISASSINQPIYNGTGGSLTPPSGTYTVYWQDRT